MFRFFIAILKNGHNSEINARSRNAALMGRVTKIRKFPSDIRRDRLRLLSAMGPKIRANTIGAMGISRRIKKYPTNAAASMIPTSNRLLRRA